MDILRSIADEIRATIALHYDFGTPPYSRYCWQPPLHPIKAAGNWFLDYIYRDDAGAVMVRIEFEPDGISIRTSTRESTPERYVIEYARPDTLHLVVKHTLLELQSIAAVDRI